MDTDREATAVASDSMVDMDRVMKVVSDVMDMVEEAV